MRTVHLAEILAARAGGVVVSTFLGLPRAAGHLEHLHGQPFPVAARAAVADTQLRRNLGNATATIRAKRARVVGEVPDWEALRAAGAAIKDSTCWRNLDELLVQLEAEVTRRGGTVHWARDAAEANAIVTDARPRDRRGPRWSRSSRWRPRRSGSTRRCEAAGIAAWETDLAELIVQLGHDKPSHILVPAIHRNRAEIREIFLREMASVGLPAPADLTDEPRALAEAARRHLRQKFLTARVAISGANFAVADDRDAVGGGVRGQRADVPHAAADPDHRDGHREAGADLDRPRGVPAAAAALVDRRADEPVHLDVDRGTRSRAEDFHLVLLDNGRTAVLGDDVRPRGAAVHPVLGLPQRVPGVRADRRARVRVGVSGADRGGALARS